MSTTIAVADAANAISGHLAFRAGKLLQGQGFFRLSGDPHSVAGLSPEQAAQLLAARRLNESHYRPFCTTCGESVTHENTLRAYVHMNEELADHVAEMAQHEDSYIDPPKGLSYVVWVGGEVAAWVLNDGTTTYIEGANKTKRAMVFAALGR